MVKEFGEVHLIQTSSEEIPIRLGWSLLSAVFGFLPVGLIALYCSICVVRRLQAEDVDTALRFSRRAALSIWAAFIMQMIVIIAIMYGHGHYYQTLG